MAGALTTAAQGASTDAPVALTWLPELLLELEYPVEDLDDPNRIAPLAQQAIQRGQATGNPAHFHAARLLGQRLKQMPNRAVSGALTEGQALLQLHYFAEAEQIADGLVADTDLPAAWQLQGDAALEQGKLLKAGVAFDALLRRQPSPLAWTRAAEWQFQTGNVERAIKLIGLALDGIARSDDKATLAWAMSQAGRYFLADNRPDVAHRLLRDANRIHDSHSIRYWLALSELAVDQPDQARQTLQQLVTDYPSPLVALTLIELQTASAGAGADALHTQITKSGAQIDARGQALFLLQTGGSITVAQQLINSELEQRRDPVTLAIAAAIAATQGKDDLARRLIDEAAKSNSAEPFVHLVAGQLLATKPIQQQRHFRQAVNSQWLLTPSQRERLCAQTVCHVSKHNQFHSDGGVIR